MDNYLIMKSNKNIKYKYVIFTHYSPHLTSMEKDGGTPYVPTNYIIVYGCSYVQYQHPMDLFGSLF